MVVYRTLSLLFTIIEFAILARVMISWFPVPRENRMIQVLYTITEPILGPIRTMISRSSFGRNMMFDFSPIVAFILLGIVQNIILRMIRF